MSVSVAVQLVCVHFLDAQFVMNTLGEEPANEEEA